MTKYPDPKLSVRKPGISRPTPSNLQEVSEQMRSVLLELQGVVGPEKLRAVRLQELLQTGVVKLTTDGQLVSGVSSSSTPPVDLSGLVPYLGAVSDVDLGEFALSLGQLNLDLTPTGTPQIGSISWNDADGTAEIRLKGGNVTLQIGQEQLLRVVNGTGQNLTEAGYKVVRVTGAQGQRPQVLLAQGNSEIASVDTIGVVTEDIAVNQEGFITTSGMVRNINTTGSLQGETWVDGDVLYLSPSVAGGLTNVKPSAPYHTVTVGIVTYAHANHGKIFVRISNGYELEELHNVKLTSVADGDVVRFNAATSLWENNPKASNSDRIDGYHVQVDGTGSDPNTLYFKTTGGEPASADKTYRHVQATPSATWVVDHNLDKYPSVTVLSSTGETVEGNVTYTTSNQATLLFSAPFAGEAYFN